MPVAIDEGAGGNGLKFAQRFGDGDEASDDLAVQFDDARHVLKLRREAHDGNAKRGDVGVVREQALAAVGHGLDTVDGEEGFFFAGVHGHAVRVLDAAELAVVFVQVVVARGEAAR